MVKIALSRNGIRRLPIRTAVSTDNGEVSAHFGRCPSFTIAEIADGRVESVEVMDNPGHHPGFAPRLLNERRVDCIVAGAMGARARELLAKYNIQTVLGVQGPVQAALEMLAAGDLTGGESPRGPDPGRDAERTRRERRRTYQA